MNTTSARLSLILSGLLLATAAQAEDPDPVSGHGDWVKKDPSTIPGSIPKVDIQAEYQVLAKLPKVPASLLQFEIQRVDPTRIDPSREPIARAIGFEGKRSGVDKAEDGALSMLLTDPEGRSIEYFSSGAVFFMAEELFSEQGEDLFSRRKWDRDQAAKWYSDQASAFLESAGLARQGMRLKDVSFTEVEWKDIKAATEQVATVGAAAHFGYSIDGIPAWGPGAKTSVYFDAEGISGVYDALPDLKPAKEVAILPPEAAVEAYMKSATPRSLYRLNTGAVEQVLIESVELVYYVDAGNRNQRVVSPHYLIRGSFLGKDLSTPEHAKDQATELRSDFVWMEPAAI
ncbi:hypothetical protein G3480_07675 [Thiorhodococcus mannitoliphagus]|uniref:Uncharacterized protein n=1 Tax=Thiorhodococcus mannitoliphagus TaxID=329406 RepID=A0A6P1DTC6_9GAMM|nr:hypothetical protein [Thiorhodococcus mannitoliphagus]NEX20191.1 hypothetical protein [Thiorhodococcus mannitoliphagus]